MYYSSQGIHTRQAHKGIPDGHIEEEQGRRGFFGPVSHLIRKQASTRWKMISGPLKPRMLDLVELEKNETRQRLLYNSDVIISSQWRMPTQDKSLRAFRNADGDTLYFCHIGSGKVLTEYGLFTYRPGDYILIPKCFGHVILPDSASQFLLIENLAGDFREPERGMVGKNAVYDTAQIDKPDLAALQTYLVQSKSKCVYVDVKHNEEITKFEYEDCIFDVVGWKGDLFPCKINMDQIMPLMSHRAHLPPSAHTTFVAQQFVVCSFVPRPIEFDDDALKVPFYHQNIDYDEVLFYHNGDFFSRANLHSGMMSFHPAGFPHGPHPQAFEKIKGLKFTNEYAVMIDSRRPLLRDPIVAKIEIENYWQSWQVK